jgi:SH3-like domain-containing protein
MDKHLLGLVFGLFALAATGLAAAPPAAAQTVVGEEHCVVHVRADDRLNLRGARHASAPILTRLPYGRCGIVVMACAGSWCRVEDGHFAGYVARHYISMVSPALYCVANVPFGDRLNLRAWPAATSRLLASLGRQQCDIAFLPYATGNWQKIRVNGYEGWVNRRYVSGQ